MKVTVQTTSGPQEVEAVPAGRYFAVHPTLVVDAKPSKYTAWTLTHVPTGYKAAALQFKKDAVACGRAFSEIGGTAWEHISPGNCRDQFDAATYRALIARLNECR
jgi:hypothetical protein